MLTDYGYISIRWIWAALTVIFALIEVFTFGLTTIWLAIAALVMVFLSFLPIPLYYQLLIFLLISAALLVFTRPLAIKKFKMGKEKTNVDSLIGKHAIVTKQISEFENGEIKINGLFWSARSSDDSQIQEGTKCEIVSIEGVKAIVKPIE